MCRRADVMYIAVDPMCNPVDMMCNPEDPMWGSFTTPPDRMRRIKRPSGSCAYTSTPGSINA